MYAGSFGIGIQRIENAVADGLSMLYVSVSGSISIVLHLEISIPRRKNGWKNGRKEKGKRKEGRGEGRKERRKFFRLLGFYQAEAATMSTLF